jgi:hypothetical protein
VRLLLGLLLAFAVAAVVGLGTTLLALSHGMAFGAFTIGAWTAWPRTGTADIDPYARAVLARTGELPMGSGDGIAFLAKTDDNGAPLDGRCDVIVSGLTPQARFWTITLYDPEGRLIGNSLNRQGFTSQEIVRKTDGSFEIAVAPRARSGNWLPSGGVERYVLVLRLYDSPVSLASRTGRETHLPVVERKACS